jgi:hypothetical protein
MTFFAGVSDYVPVSNSLHGLTVPTPGTGNGMFTTPSNTLFDEMVSNDWLFL